MSKYHCPECGAMKTNQMVCACGHDFNQQPKEEMYTTAYSPLFECFVKIDKARKDDRGEWIFHCSNEEKGLSNHLFRKCELERFTI